MFRKSPLATAVSVALTAGTFGFSAQALAQDPEDSEAEDEDAIEEIVTTGSRIRRDQFSSNAPIDVVLTEAAELKGVGDVAEMLQTTVIAAGSAQVTVADSTAFVRGGGTGAATLSLRGLGANRTLSLLNGRRAGPAGTRGGVSSFDLNVIPLAALERVEILKDGASSIYGSDAVAGVVNYITKKDDGITIEGYTSQPAESGGEVNRLSASFGKTFSRGRFRVTGDFYRTEELEQRDRSYLNCEADYTFDPNTGLRNDRIDSRTGEPWCGNSLWGQIWIYDYNQYYYDANIPLNSLGATQLAQYDYDGDLGNYIPQNPIEGYQDSEFGVQIPEGWYLVGYDRVSDGVTNGLHPALEGSSVIPEVDRKTFFGDAEFELTDTMTLYGEVLLNRRETTVDSFRQFWSYIYNSDDGCGGCFFGSNPDPQAAGWTGWNWLSPTGASDHAGSQVTVDYSRYLAGLRGDINDNWSFDINYQYSKSDGDYNDKVIYDDSLRSTNFSWFGDVPCVDGATAVRGVTCMDLPWLDPEFMAGNLTAEQRDFLYGIDRGNTEYTQSTWEAYVTGELFELPAGGVQTAIGVHYREDEINDVPGEASRVDNSWNRTSAGITAGKDTTQAIFAEFDIPLVADKPGFRELNFNASARYTDVDSYGSDTTYKASLNWQVVEAFRIRANHGTSFRTPALFELYLADQTGSLRQSAVDPCIRWGTNLDAGNISQTTADNCAATVTNEFPDGLPDDFTGGNISATTISRGGIGILKAETSDATTIGLVWTPEFADLSVALDHFEIQVDDQVDQLGSSLVRGCYASEFFPDDPLCQLFDRSLPGSSIDNILDAYVNVATQKNSGWDLTARYTTEIGPGTLVLNTQHTIQDEASTELFEGFGRDRNGELGEPEYVGQLSTTYFWDDWTFFWGVDIIGRASSVERNNGDLGTVRGLDVRYPLRTDAVEYHDFSVSKAFDNGVTVLAGVSNAFDRKPPQLTSVNLGVVNVQGTSAFYSQYDWLGQRWFLQLRYELD